jgi:murein DD-endopeptidase MepM/ murein hydrolase activator NlpD
MAIFGDKFRTHARGWFLIALLSVGSPVAAMAGTEPGKMLEVIPRNEDGVIHFCVQNLMPTEVTATIDLRLSNLKASTSFPCTATIPAQQTVELFALNRIIEKDAANYKYTYAAILGSVDSVHEDSHVYLLPYAPGIAFRVSQGNHGSFSHTGPDEYAIDWAMPVGTPVLAARGGLVVKTKDDSNEGGPDRKYLNLANCILIRHDDGTIGMYGHLKQGGSRVKVGDVVQAGNVIGFSGNTGFSQGPHLHFSVFKAKNGRERLSLPVKFLVAGGGAQILEAGRTYLAPPALPGQFIAGSPSVESAR